MLLVNQLEQAILLIGTSKATLFYPEADIENVDGLIIPQYSQGLEVEVCAQPLDSKTIQYMGMTSSQYPYRFYLLLDLTIASGLTDDGSCKILFNGYNYVLTSIVDWHAENGWVECIGVRSE